MAASRSELGDPGWLWNLHGADRAFRAGARHRPFQLAETFFNNTTQYYPGRIRSPKQVAGAVASQSVAGYPLDTRTGESINSISQWSGSLKISACACPIRACAPAVSITAWN